MLMAARALRANAADMRLTVNGTQHTGAYSERFDGQTIVDSPLVIANRAPAPCRRW